MKTKKVNVEKYFDGFEKRIEGNLERILGVNFDGTTTDIAMKIVGIEECYNVFMCSDYREEVNKIYKDSVLYDECCIDFPATEKKLIANIRLNIDELKKSAEEVLIIYEDFLAKQKKDAKEEEVFEKRWGVKKTHFEGKFMRFVNNVNELCEGTCTEYRRRIIKVYEIADYDYNYYAKSYGHPKKNVISRNVVFFRKNKNGDIIEDKRVYIESFRKKNILSAIDEYFKK